MVTRQEAEAAFQLLREKFNQETCDLLRGEAVSGLVRILRKRGFDQWSDQDLKVLANGSFNLTMANCKRFSAWKQCYNYMIKTASCTALKEIPRRMHETHLPGKIEFRDHRWDLVFEGIDLAQALESLKLKKRDLELLESLVDAQRDVKAAAKRKGISSSTLKRRRKALIELLRKRLKDYRP